MHDDDAIFVHNDTTNNNNNNKIVGSSNNDNRGGSLARASANLRRIRGNNQPAPTRKKLPGFFEKGNN